MRLVYIANANSIHTRRWLDPFIQCGDDVHLLSYMRVEQPWKGVRLIDLTRLPGPPKGKLYNWARWLRGYLRQIRPDILHAHQVTIAGWLGALTGFHPYVISAWGSDLLLAPDQSRRERWKIKFALRRCDGLTTPSSLMYSAAQRLGMSEQRLHLIPWGVETDIFSPSPQDQMATRLEFGIGQKEQVIFCPRGVRPVYNHDILIRAVAALPQHINRPTICFLDFNSAADYKAELQQIIESNGVTSSVRWLPPQANAEAMARLYRMADAVVSIPSSEGYGFSVFEALACGAPTLITDLPIFQDDLEDEKHVLKTPVRDVSATANALQRLLTDHHLRERLHENGPAAVRAMSVSRRIRLTDALYSELAGSR